MLLSRDTRATSPSRRTWLSLLTLAGGVAWLHLALWYGVADSLAASAAPERSKPSLQVRTVEPPLALQSQVNPQPMVAKPAPAPRRKPAAVLPPVAAEPAEMLLVAAALPAKPASEPASAATAAAAAQEDVPVYRTTVPPSITLNYEMRSGALSGTGELQWRNTGTGYEARLEGRVLGFRILSWVSQGGFDAAGLAPLRYTDQRRSKGVQAANFQREAGKISFSGPSTEYPLLQGSQDRLSWMIQIAAIASADPQRLATGSRLAMFVVGARGDAEVWAFKVVGTEEVTTGDATVRAIKLLREPRRAYDTQVEVWLAPGLHYLPVRARLSNEGSSALELRLQTAQTAS